MATVATERLRDIKTLPQLVAFFRDELGWPIGNDSIEDITYQYNSDELGLDTEHAAKVREIKQLRPLTGGQPWGVFWVSFEKKRLPIVVLRRILANLVIKSRSGAKSSDRPRWQLHDLLFISAFGDEASNQREVAFAHFHQEDDDLPTLRVLGWDGADTPLKLEHVASTLRERLHWPKTPTDVEAWRSQWSGAFRHRLGHVIRTADSLAEVLAALAKRIRSATQRLMNAESDKGPLTKLYKAFQSTLIHDLTPETFADTYAQTITYGLLTAAISRTEMSAGRHGTALIADNVTDMVPVTNPFLKEMLEEFLKVGGRKGGIDFDELGVQDVVELLRGDETDLPEVLRNFGDRKPGEDPVIHFYEHFLSAYDKKLKIKRGVFYTPQPVVSYIVRSVHELLQTEFGLRDGLADITTWGEMLKRQPGLKLPTTFDDKNKEHPISQDEAFVQVLDPATGTATFLVEVIDVIYKHLHERWKKSGTTALPKMANHKAKVVDSFADYWNGYVPEHLLPRLHGYELLMAPYAIAHMKIGLKLAETGYRFDTEERARIYLTNALEPWVRQLPLIGFDALAHEAAVVNEIKRHKRFTIVIGNPPYSHRANLLSPEQRALIDPYKFINGQRMRVRGALQLERNLNDDYVKFVRFAQLSVDQASVGVAGLITNSAYLENVTFPGMRSSLATSFDWIQIVNLHGSVKAGCLSPSGEKDANVFDIQQGVAISILCRRANETTSLTRRYADLWGSRSFKEETLRSQPGRLQFRPFLPVPEHYLFVPTTSADTQEYLNWKSLDQIFSQFGTGIMTNRNGLTIAPYEDELLQIISIFTNPALSDSEVSQQLGVKSNALWDLNSARNQLRQLDAQEFFRPVDFRPFDTQVVFYHEVAVDNLRRHVMNTILRSGNRALVVSRQQFTAGFRHVFVTRRTFDECFISTASREKASGFPMFGLSESSDDLRFGGEQHNIRESFLPVFRDFPDNERLSLQFHYIYAVLHSSNYRARYEEHLKRGYAHIPETEDRNFGACLAGLGTELVAIHLLESPKLDKSRTEFIGDRKQVEKVSYSKNTVWIDEAKTAGFRGVPDDVWNFRIGGYQVCEKWLKDRKGRTLSRDDIGHYHKIVIALAETIRLISDIDNVIEKHGGWPSAFQQEKK